MRVRFLCLISLCFLLASCEQANFLAAYLENERGFANQERDYERSVVERFPKPYRKLCVPGLLDNGAASGLEAQNDGYDPLIALLRENPLTIGDGRNDAVLDCLGRFASAAGNMAGIKGEVAGAPLLQTLLNDTAYFLDRPGNASTDGSIALRLLNEGVVKNAAAITSWETPATSALRERAADLLEAAASRTEPATRYAIYATAAELTTTQEKRSALYTKTKPYMQARFRSTDKDAAREALRWLIRRAGDDRERSALLEQFLAGQPSFKDAGWHLAYDLAPEFNDAKEQRNAIKRLTATAPAVSPESRALYHHLYETTGNPYWMEQAVPKLMQANPGLVPHKAFFTSEALMILGDHEAALKERASYMCANYTNQYADQKSEIALYSPRGVGYAPKRISRDETYSLFYWRDKTLTYRYWTQGAWFKATTSCPAHVLSHFENTALRCFRRNREDGPVTPEERQCVRETAAAMQIKELPLSK